MRAERQGPAPGRLGSGAAVIAGFGALGAGLLVALFALWRDRLPDPMAGHFALSGEADGYLAPGTWLAVALGLVAGMAAMFAALLRLGGRRGQRRTGFAAGVGVLTLLTTIFVTSLHANLDLAEGSEATLPAGWIGVALVLGAGVATAGWRLAGPDAPLGPAVYAADRMELGEGEVASWSRSAGPWQMWVPAVAIGLAGVLLLALGEAPIGLLLLAGAVVMGAFSRVLVTVDRRGLRVSPFGLSFPCKRIALDAMDSAASREIAALAEFGGWGYRVRPGASGVVLRSGPALSVRLRTGREFVVTVADSATAAALLNGLIERSRRAGEG